MVPISTESSSLFFCVTDELINFRSLWPHLFSNPSSLSPRPHVVSLHLQVLKQLINVNLRVFMNCQSKLSEIPLKRWGHKVFLPCECSNHYDQLHLGLSACSIFFFTLNETLNHCEAVGSLRFLHPVNVGGTIIICLELIVFLSIFLTNKHVKLIY